MKRRNFNCRRINVFDISVSITKRREILLAII